MFTPPVAIVHEVFDEEKVLQEHFDQFYIFLSENHLVSNASFDFLSGGVKRCLSGIPMPYHNAVLGCPHDVDWDICIQEQMHYFNEEKMPFAWYLDENSSSEFKEKLISYGFQDGGIFRGVIGTLDKTLLNFQIPSNCVLEQVEDEATLDEFNEVFSSVFDLQGVSKDLHKIVLSNSIKGPNPTMFHWVARQDGKVVSVVSTIIEGDLVSFWNGATLPEFRRQGYSTALRSLALTHSISRGCKLGASYLMSEGMALGICSRFGYQTKWRFNAFIAPNNLSHT